MQLCRTFSHCRFFSTDLSDWSCYCCTLFLSDKTLLQVVLFFDCHCCCYRCCCCCCGCRCCIYQFSCPAPAAPAPAAAAPPPAAATSPPRWSATTAQQQQAANHAVVSAEDKAFVGVAMPKKGLRRKYEGDPFLHSPSLGVTIFIVSFVLRRQHHRMVRRRLQLLGCHG